jgi:hypothetical protein
MADEKSYGRSKAGVELTEAQFGVEPHRGVS